MSVKEKHSNDLLLLLLKKGDEAAFSRIYHLFWNKLYYVAFQKLRNQEAAEEVVQGVFLTLWKKRNQLEIENLSNYLAAMARHSVYRYLVNKEGRKNHETIYHEQQNKFLYIDEIIENRLILDKILELSNRLPEKCRLVFQYNKLEDRSIQEIAKHLNISQKTAEAHLTKALKTIRLSIRSLLMLFL